MLADARDRAAEAFRAEVLAKRAKTWRQWQEQAAYVDELMDRLPKLPEEIQSRAEECLAWARTHLSDTDPTNLEHDMPTIPEPTKEFLEPHIRGWAGHYRSFPA